MRAVGATGPVNIYLSVAGVHVEFSVDWSDLFKLVDETRVVDKDVGRLLRAQWPATFIEQVAAGDGEPTQRESCSVRRSHRPPVHGWRRLLSTVEDAVAGHAGVTYLPAVSAGPAPARIVVPPRTFICASVSHSAPRPTAHVPCQRCRSVFYCSGRCASLDRERHCSEEEGTCFDWLTLMRDALGSVDDIVSVIGEEWLARWRDALTAWALFGMNLAQQEPDYLSTHTYVPSRPSSLIMTLAQRDVRVDTAHRHGRTGSDQGFLCE